MLNPGPTCKEDRFWPPPLIWTISQIVVGIPDSWKMRVLDHDRKMDCFERKHPTFGKKMNKITRNNPCLGIKNPRRRIWSQIFWQENAEGFIRKRPVWNVLNRSNRSKFFDRNRSNFEKQKNSIFWSTLTITDRLFDTRKELVKWWVSIPLKTHSFLGEWTKKNAKLHVATRK